MEPSNQQLVARIAAGDRDAFAEFYNRHSSRVYSLLLKWLGGRAEAEDVLQEVFWQVWCKAGQYDARRSPPEAWLFLLARSRGTDFLRQHRPDAALPAGQEPAGPGDPSHRVEQEELTGQVRHALASLPEEQRRAIMLTFYTGLTNEQLARYLDIPLGTAKTRIRLGMERLRCLLDDCAR
jgi:RNA polymerase sigma-70 factor (ECF subfamily)